MKTVSIMEAQHNLSKVLHQVEEGHEVYVTRRRKVIARILPAETGETVRFPDFASRARASWGDQWTGSGSDQLLDEARGDK